MEKRSDKVKKKRENVKQVQILTEPSLKMGVVGRDEQWETSRIALVFHDRGGRDVHKTKTACSFQKYALYKWVAGRKPC